MIPESRYLEFYKVANLPKTDVWDILSKEHGFKLGTIKWFGRWRQYCFFPCSETVFNVECLSDIQDFIKQLKVARSIKAPG